MFWVGGETCLSHPSSPGRLPSSGGTAVWAVTRVFQLWPLHLLQCWCWQGHLRFLCGTIHSEALSATDRVKKKCTNRHRVRGLEVMFQLEISWWSMFIYQLVSLSNKEKWTWSRNKNYIKDLFAQFLSETVAFLHSKMLLINKTCWLVLFVTIFCNTISIFSLINLKHSTNSSFLIFLISFNGIFTFIHGCHNILLISQVYLFLTVYNPHLKCIYIWMDFSNSLF